MLFPLFSNSVGPWRSGWSTEKKSRKSIIIRGVSVALFVEEKEKAEGEELQFLLKGKPIDNLLCSRYFEEFEKSP